MVQLNEAVSLIFLFIILFFYDLFITTILIFVLYKLQFHAITIPYTIYYYNFVCI